MNNCIKYVNSTGHRLTSGRISITCVTQIFKMLEMQMYFYFSSNKFARRGLMFSILPNRCDRMLYFILSRLIGHRTTARNRFVSLFTIFASFDVSYPSDTWWRHHMGIFSALHKGQWRGALMSSLICAWINGWVNNREIGDLRCHRTHYDVIVMT